MHGLIWGVSLEIVSAQPIWAPSLFKKDAGNLHEHSSVCDYLECSVRVLVILKMEIQFAIFLRAGKLRTSSGIQYADLSSLTLHVEHRQFRRSAKEVLYPMAGNIDQIFFYRCWTQISAPLEPIIVWAWLLALPGLTIGSTRASRTGLAQGKRQKALAEETRSPTAKKEKIII